MKKMFTKKFFSLFICLCLICCAVPVTVYATNSNKETESRTSEQTEEKEIKKTEISMGSVYTKVYDGKEVSKSDVYALVSGKSGGVTVFTYTWWDSSGDKMENPPVEAGEYKLAIQVSKDDPLFTGSAIVSYIIEQRPLEWDISDIKVKKAYDGTVSAAPVKGEIKISGVVNGDDVTLKYDSVTAGDFPTEDVQRVSVPLSVNNAVLEGEDAANYTLPKLSPVVEASVVKAYITEVTFPDDDNKYRVVVEEAVYVTDSLSATEFATEDAIKTALRTKVFESFPEAEEVNVVFYTPILQVLEGEEWIDVTEENWPEDGMAVTLAYPEGTSDSTHEFIIYRMKANGDDAGTIEVWAHTELAEGLETVLSQGDTLVVGYTLEKSTNMPLMLAGGSAAVLAVSGAIYLKLRKKDREEELASGDDPQQQ